MSRDRDESSPPRGSLLLYGATAGVLAFLAVVAGLTIGAAGAVPILILAVVVLGFLALNDVWAKRNLDRHGGDPVAAQDDETERLPTAHVIPDETALGDTAEAHAEINPLDLPRDSPARPAAEQQTEEAQTGTTRGHEEGAAGGRRLDEEEPPPSRGEGYEGDRPVSSPRGT